MVNLGRLQPNYKYQRRAKLNQPLRGSVTTGAVSTSSAANSLNDCCSETIEFVEANEDVCAIIGLLPGRHMIGRSLSL